MNGDSYGADVLLRQFERGPIQRLDLVHVRGRGAQLDRLRYFPGHDRRHDLNVVGAGDSRSTCSAFATATRPARRTPTSSARSCGASTIPGSTRTARAAADAQTEFIGGTRNGARLPTTQRLDLDVTRTLFGARHDDRAVPERRERVQREERVPLRVRLHEEPADAAGDLAVSSPPVGRCHDSLLDGASVAACALRCAVRHARASSARSTCRRRRRASSCTACSIRARRDQVVLVERTLTGAVDIPDTSFDSTDPIVSAGGIPIIGRDGRDHRLDGDVSRGVEDRTCRTRRQGLGRLSRSDPRAVARARRAISAAHSHAGRRRGDGVDANSARPTCDGRRPHAHVQSRSRRVRRAVARARRRAQLRRARREPVRAVLSVHRQPAVRLTGDLRNLFAGELQRVFIPGFRQDIIVAAVDSNFYDYYRTNNDPFTGAGIISRDQRRARNVRIDREAEHGTLTVTADQTEPIEGRFRVQPPVDSRSPVAPFTLYVESPASKSDLPAALSGRYAATGPNARVDGVIGKLSGTTWRSRFSPISRRPTRSTCSSRRARGDTLTAFAEPGGDNLRQRRNGLSRECQRRCYRVRATE